MAGWFVLPTDAGPHAAIMRRLAALAQRLEERRAAPLLSAPTHRGGWIEPTALATRIASSAEIDDDDLAQALLRLRPADDEQARTDAAELPGEAALALRVALGDDLTPPGHSLLPASWDAVALLRSDQPADAEPPLKSWSRPVQAPPCCPVTLLARAAPATPIQGMSISDAGWR